MAIITLSEIELEEILTEIIAGKKFFTFNDKVMAMKFPSSEDKDNSRIFYIRRYKELISYGLPKKEDFIQFLMSTGNLDKDFYKTKKMLEARLNKLMEVRDKTNSDMQLIQIKKDMYSICDKITDMEVEESSLLLNTAEVSAESYRINYLIFCCLLCGDELNERYWKNFDEFKKERNIDLLRKCKSVYRELNKGISGEKIRAVARSDEWSKRWTASKKTGSPVFSGSISDWDKNKVELCYWSNFYDNIRENYHEISSDLYDDDEKLFSTLKQLNRENARTKTKHELDEGSVTTRVNSPYKIRY